jgi:hypothetical protein
MKQKLELIPQNTDFISGVLTALTGNTFIPRVDTPNSLLQYAFAFNDNTYIDANTEGPNHKELIVKSVIEDSGKDSREYIISKKLGLYSNREQNGVDAYELDELSIKNTWELKSERLRKNKKSKTGYSKLAGNFSVSSKLIKYKETVDEWVNKNDKVAISGWVNGQVAYVLSFSTKKSGIREHILNRLDNNAKLENGGICFTYTNFIDAKDLTLEYIDTKLCTLDYVTEPLLAKIVSLSTKSTSTTRSGNLLEKYSDVVNRLSNTDKTGIDIAKELGISKTTVYRVKRQMMLN